MTRFTDTAVSTNLATDKLPTETALGVKGYSTPATLKTYTEVGTATNDSAAAGSKGELLSTTVESGSAVSLTTNTNSNITSVSLTAGDWDVDGLVVYDPDTTTEVTELSQWISTTSASLPTPPAAGYTLLALAFTIGSTQALTTGTVRISVASTTTVYLSVRPAFATSTMVGYGIIRARRVR